MLHLFRISLPLIFLFLTNFSVNGSGNINWYHIEKAQELNKKEPKKFLIDVYTDWCGWCKKMDNTTFSHPEIAQYINENFYPVKLNAESNQSIEFAGKTYVNKGQGRRPTHQLAIGLLQGKMSYPSIAYLNENLQLLSAVPGFHRPADFEPIIKFFGEEAYKEQSWESFMNNFEGSIQASE